MPPSDRPLVMGIVNVTPDSFSDGGRFLDASAAVRHGLALAADGAYVLDVGGESTRPGADPGGAAEEKARVLPVIRDLVAEAGVPVSVDTSKVAVAEAALEAGATIVNDVTAGSDPAMMPLVAAAGAGYVAMHMRGEPRTMQLDPRYDDVVSEVTAFLRDRVEAAVAAGIRPGAVMADPGIGFGKTLEHNLRLLARLDEVVAGAGAPLVVGTSRKGFLGQILDVPVDDREEATLATVVWAFDKGASMVRVHDVKGAARAARLLDALARATPDGIQERLPA